MATSSSGSSGDTLDLLDLHSLTPENRALIEEFLGTQEAILRAAETGAISTYVPYPHQKRLHESQCSSRYLLGANKIGKSFFIAQEVGYFARGEHPHRKLTRPAKLIWCCCPTEELMLMYQFPEVRAAIGEGNIATVKLGAHPRIILKNGCVVLFKYYAQGARAFPTAGVDLICFDEEPPWAVFEECWARRSTRELNFVGAITTVDGLTPFITRIVEGELPDCTFETASIDDNPAIPASEKEKFKQGLRHNPVAYKIRVEGKILPVGGTTRFDANALWGMQREDVCDPIARFVFDFANERWVQDETGPLWLWEFAEEGHDYVIGGDTAEGLNVSESETDPIYDNTVLTVLHRTDERVVAEYVSGTTEPGKVGEFILPRLHLLYNRAWANIELNNHGQTVVYEARKHMAGRLWSPVKDIAGRAQLPGTRLGTMMSQPSRRIAIDALANEIVDRKIEVPSGHCVREMMRFVRKANGRIEHVDGEKDDRVFALAHAIVCHRGLPPPRVKRPPTLREQFRKEELLEARRRKKVQWFRKIA